MLGNWLTGIAREGEKKYFRGGMTLIWAIWCSRNDIVFEKK